MLNIRAVLYFQTAFFKHAVQTATQAPVNIVRLSLVTLIGTLCLSVSAFGYAETWLLVDDFESENSAWTVSDVQNETLPFIENPQVFARKQTQNGNTYYLKKPAPDGVIGNRKALSYIKLPESVVQGEVYTFYTRIMVESFPNNHSFGLSNLDSAGIDKNSYNAFEPMLRVTDKQESNGAKNTGALMVIASAQNGKARYSNVQNNGADAKPMQTGTWYELWYVINNKTSAVGGQSYQVFMKGGEFEQQTEVFTSAKFRMQREQALGYFVTIANTGPHKQPYGNGGLAFDDIYMIKGTDLTTPQVLSQK